MKMHIIFLHPSVWEIICVGIDILNNNEPLTMEQAQDLHHNPQSQAGYSSISEPNKVNGLKIAKDIWDTL